MANRYWVGGTGNWSDNTNHWSDTSGGSPGASVPTSADSVYFNALSFTATGQVVTVDVSANCLDMDWTGALYSPQLASTSSINIYGSLILISDMNYSFGSVLYFRSTTTGKTITLAGKNPRNIIFDGLGGGWTLQDDLIFYSGRSLIIDKGTLYTNNKSITTAGITITDYTMSAGGFILGSSQIICSSNFYYYYPSANFTFDTGTSTIIMMGDTKTFQGGGSIYNNVEFQGTPTTIIGSNTFNELKIDSGKTAVFTAGTTQTVTTLIADGATLQSSTAGSPYIISKASGTCEVTGASIQDCTASGGATFIAFNSVNVSGNLGWIFRFRLLVDENGYLQPLGVKVLRGVEFIRNFKDYSEEIPGKDGEILFGVDMEAGLISLPCFIETTPDTWDAKEAEIMGYLNPKLGVQTLTFANRPGKVYNVLYIGQLKFAEEGPGYRKFTIPFKMHDPIIKASTQSSLTGSGTAVNGGNDETPCIVEIVGLVTNPSVTIGGKTMTYTGTVTASDMLIIDTEKMTCTFNGANAMANYNKVFPKLAVGNNTVTAASAGTTTVKWYNRWQ